MFHAMTEHKTNITVKLICLGKEEKVGSIILHCYMQRLGGGVEGEGGTESPKRLSLQFRGEWRRTQLLKREITKNEKEKHLKMKKSNMIL